MYNIIKTFFQIISKIFIIIVLRFFLSEFVFTHTHTQNKWYICCSCIQRALHNNSFNIASQTIQQFSLTFNTKTTKYNDLLVEVFLTSLKC